MILLASSLADSSNSSVRELRHPQGGESALPCAEEVPGTAEFKVYFRQFKSVVSALQG